MSQPQHPTPFRSLFQTLRLQSRCLQASRWLTAGLLSVLIPALHAEENTSSTNPRTVNARLDFTINIDKMIYLRIDGVSVNANSATDSGQGPAATGDISELEFNPEPSIPSLGFTPVGNAGNVNWDTNQPRLVNTPEQRLFVEVRSNAGVVNLQAQVITPLTNGTDTIPFSKIRIGQTNSALPAPDVPDTGIGPSEAVSTGGNGTSAAPSLLTHRFGQWQFRYLPGATSAANPFPRAGVYRGELAFIATAI